MATITVSSWRRWFSEVGVLAQRTDASPTPIILYWLAIEEYLAAVIQSLQMAEEAYLSDQYLYAKLVLPTLNGESDSVVSRYKVMAALFGKLPIDSGTHIWQNLDLLQKCRNCIVHPKPFITERPTLKYEDGDAIQIHEFHRKLLTRLKAARLVETSFEHSIGATWHTALSSPKVHAWAETTCKEFIEYIASLLPVSGTQITWHHEHLRPFFEDTKTP
jgi:hypothetical protein